MFSRDTSPTRMMATARSNQRSALAERIKQSVTMEEAVRVYGLEPNRAGFLQCPFHKGDNTASLKIYPGNRGWYCFGCHRGGGVIEFVMQLYGLDFRQAVLRIDHDFGLNTIGTAPAPEESQALKLRRQEAEARKQHSAEYTAQWEKSIDLTKEIDRLSDQVLALVDEREQLDRWLEEHSQWGRKG